MEFDQFLSHLADYLNVKKGVMKLHYNRHSVLQQNVEVQKVLAEGQLKEVSPALEEVNQLMDPLLEGQHIPHQVPEVGRPVRTQLDDKAWKKQWKRQSKRKAEVQQEKKEKKKKKAKKQAKKKETDEEEEEEGVYEVKKILARS